MLLRGKEISVPEVAPIPDAKDITSREEENKGQAIGEMGVKGVEPFGSPGTQSNRPIEQGSNNKNTPKR